MKISTVIGGGIVFVAGIGAGMYLACEAAVKLDEKVYKGKLREKFVEATSDTVTSFMHEKFEPKKFEPKRFEPKRFEYSRHDCERHVFETRNEAEETLRIFNHVIDMSGFVSIADYCNLIGVIHYHSDTNRGWKEKLSDDMIIDVEDGWIINFPEWRTL